MQIIVNVTTLLISLIKWVVIETTGVCCKGRHDVMLWRYISGCYIFLDTHVYVFFFSKTLW